MMDHPPEEKPKVSIESISHTHKPSNGSSWDTSNSSKFSQENLTLPACPVEAHPHDTVAVNKFQAEDQMEKAEPTVMARDPSSESRPAAQSKDKCNWPKATCTMVAETLSLGILSLPQAVSKLGIIPGVILLIVLGFITTGTGYCYYLYKMKYPHIRSIPQALDNIFGAPGRWITDLIIMVYLICLMAGHLILFSGFVQAFSTRDDSPCRVAIMAIAFFINCLFTFYRKFARLGYVCTACCLSIVIATFVCLGFLAANKAQNMAPGLNNYPAFLVTPIGLRYGVEGKVTTFFAACSAFSNILLSYSGSICYLNIIDEMEEPKHFWKCLLVTNALTITMYTIAGVGMYALAGQIVQSPALGSAGLQGAKIAYCFALPTILLAAVILANVLSKRTEDIYYAWRKLDADQQHISQKHWCSPANLIWYSIVIVWWTLAFIIGNSLPWFGPLLAIIGAFSGNWICLGWPAMFMLHIWRPEVIVADGIERKLTFREVKEAGGWWRKYKATTRRRKILVPVMFALILLNIAASGVGLYGSILEFKAAGQGRKAFSCEYDWS